MEPLTNPHKFRIRCSAIGQIMGKPRGKSVADQLDDLAALIEEKEQKLAAAKAANKMHLITNVKLQNAVADLKAQFEALEPHRDRIVLSETCKTYLKKWLIEKVMNKHTEISSKETTKGDTVEGDSIAFASINIPEMEFAVKNDEYLQDEWMHGTPDVLTRFAVWDMKNSFSHTSFPLLENELPEEDYSWQVLGYMSLSYRVKGYVVYALMNMTDDLIAREVKFKLGEEYTKETYDAFVSNYKYDDLPPYLRLKYFEVEYCKAKVQAIRDRVLACRKYIDEVLWPMIQQNHIIFPNDDRF